MRNPRHVSAASIVVALAVLASIGVIIWVWSIVRTEPSPLDSTPVATDTAVSTPVASPTTEPGQILPSLPLVTVQRIDRGTLPDLMRYSPDRLADDSLPLSDVAQYANISAWMSSRNIDIPEDPADPAFAAWEQEMENLAIPTVLATRGNDDIWVETYGFRLSDVDQVLAVGQAPDLVLILRGDFDPAQLQAAWVESGYQAVRSEGVTLWSLFPGEAVDLSAPASRPALGNMNNVVLLDDGTLIATSRMPRLEQSIRAVQGTEPSLNENPQIGALLAPGTFPYRLDTAVILKGSILATDPAGPVVVATPERTPWVGDATPIVNPEAQSLALPEATLMLAGMEAPFNPDEESIFSMVLTYDTADDAVQAALRAERTIRHAESPVTGERYRERFDLQSTRTYASGDGQFALYLTAYLPLGTGDWLTLIEERDLGFVMWTWEP
jgi:hypothetical protein